jgi:hypothetical protein
MCSLPLPRLVLGALWLTLLLAPVGALGASNMIGRQSQNEGMVVVPASGKVAVDGDLKEWDWSGRIWVFADTAVRDRYSVEAAAMWDKDALYLAAKWKDPLPLNSLIDPAFFPDEGWKEDAWQMRLTTSDRTLWITTWYFATKKQSVMHLDYWKDYRDLRPGKENLLLVSPDGGTLLGQGAELAYRADADGKGFSQEMRIPWVLLFKAVPEIKAGLTMRMGNEFLWGDPTGKTWPAHRYADNMQPGKTSREFFWTARDVWGDLKLVEKGNVPVREYRSDDGRIPGTVPVRATIPTDASRFTLVIEDAQGRRIRSLAGDCLPDDYRVAGKAPKGQQTVEVLWDGLNDQGKLVAPGAYRVRGLTHQGLGAEYEMCFYNPGTPPWATKDGRGAWGADHSGPIAVASGGDWTVVTFPVVEGGCGILGLDPTGQKRWSDRRGIDKVTADADYAYAYVTHWYTPETLCRFGIKDGSMQPFVQDGKPRTFDLPLKELLGTETPGKITGMAVNGGTLVLAMTSGVKGETTGKLVVLDAASAAVRKQFPVAAPGEIAFTREGVLYAVLEGKVCRVDLATGTLTPILTPGLGKAAALATDLAGNVVIADGGPDSQVKAYSPLGKLVYTCGKKGGRPIRGLFDPQGMIQMSSVTVDGKGQLWVVENWGYPRRVSVWGKDGKLVRDYLGNTGYAGVSCYLHDSDPTLAYCGPMEFKIDPAKGTWQMNRVLWVPDSTKGESFTISTGANTIPQRFTSAASGKAREYLFSHEAAPWEGTGNVVYMERKGNWQPVAAICLVGHISGRTVHGGAIAEAPSGEFAGLNPYDGVVWNDTNRDARVQRSECTIVLTSQPATEKSGGRPAFPIANGWGGRIGEDMSIYTDGLTRWKPVTFTDDGAPIYSLDGRYPLAVKDHGDLVPVPGENTLIVLSFMGYAGPTKLLGVDLTTQAVTWSYPNPYPGVHGSHNATMPKPGLLIGPLKTLGVANMGEGIGNVFAMRGNLGQDFFLTTDGLYVGALFQDGRLPGEGLPDKEASLRGMPMESFSEGGEPFNGWFGKHTDGKVRLTTGMAREAGMILRITGLESIKRFTGGTLTVDAAAIVNADVDNSARARVTTAPKRYAVQRLEKPFTVDATPEKWAKVPALAIVRDGQPDRATAKLAYDAQNLYLLVEVTDASPWRNEGKDSSRLFKTGDAVDLQLSVTPDGKPHRDPQAGDLRIVFSQLAGKPVAVLMAPVDPTAPKALAKSYTTGWTKKFDRVEVLADAQVAVKVGDGRYWLEASVPLATLKLAPKAGGLFRGDVGFISSDAAGMLNTARTYWANPSTNLVNDLPLEAWLTPDSWGELSF